MSGFEARIVRSACKLYPRTFRALLARDLVKVFDLEREARLRRKGRWAALRFSAATVAGVLLQASGEWLRSGGKRVDGAGKDVDRAAARSTARGAPLSPRPPRGTAGIRRLSAALDAFARDCRYALRSFAAQPGFTLTAIIVFALAIGANTAVFSLLEASLLRSLPFAESDRLVDVNELPRAIVERGDAQGGGGVASLPAYQAWKQHASLFEEMAVYSSSSYVVSGLGEAERVAGYDVSSNLFAMLGAGPLLGRSFLPEEDAAGAPKVVVLSHAFWTSRFARSADVIGTTMSLDGEAYEIVGVMPDGFRFPAFPAPSRDSGTTFWLPFGLAVDELERSRSSQGGCWVIGRLRAGVTPQQARTQLDQILARLERDERRREWVANVTPLHDFVVEDAGYALILSMGAVSLVLLIGCSNVANLLLARAVARSRELSVRMAIGASTARVLTQVLIEASLLASAGGLLGLLAAHLAIPLLAAFSAELLPAINEPTINPIVLGTTVAATFGCGILAGIAPAFSAARRAGSGSLALAARSEPGRGRGGRAMDTFIVMQVALTIVLVVAAALLGRSLMGLLAVDLGFAADDLVVAEASPPAWRYPDDVARAGYARGLLERAAATPGVADVAAASAAPFDGSIVSSVSVPDAPERDGVWASVVSTSSNYFEIAGIPLLRGEIYRDMPAAAPVAVIDRAAADAYFPGEDPLGRRLATYRWRDNPLTVIGVVDNTMQDSLREAPPPHVYVPYFAAPESMLRVVARVTGDAGAVAAALDQAIRAVDPLVPIQRVTPARTAVIDSLQRERFYTLLLGAFALTATLMAGMGIFGLTRYAVSRQVREIGIRMALGARAEDILRLILGRSLRLTGVGIVLGVAGAAAVTRVLGSFLFELSPLDPLTFVGAGSLLVALGGIASVLPALRGSRTDPIESVRVE